jgi:membrane-associated phospholipid phosphatase
MRCPSSPVTRSHGSTRATEAWAQRYGNADAADGLRGAASGYDGAVIGQGSKRVVAWTLAGAFAFAAVFASLAEDVHDHERWSLDRTLLVDLHHYHPRSLTDAWLALTQLGGYLVTGVAAAAIAGWLWRRRGGPRQAVFVAAAVGGAMLLGVAAKAAFHRPRPHLWPSAAPTLGYSFPSAHAMNSIALAAAITLITAAPPRRRLIAILGALYVGLVGLSRVWLGAHYPTDVVAGWALSLSWVLLLLAGLHLVAMARRGYGTPRSARRGRTRVPG